MKIHFYQFILLTLLTCSFTPVLFAQHQADTWYFGTDGAGLRFSECQVTTLTNGHFEGYEGVATISDKITGELLFYTNSEWVMNKMHDTIPNSNLIVNGNTITQVLILQKPGSNTIYYIITSEVQGFSGQHYRYHAVDISMNGGLGGMLFKDSVLYNMPSTEKITAIKHNNGNDLWIVGHEYNTNNFLSFHYTASGINTTPVVSAIGKVHGDPSTASAVGELKASPNGQKIACVTLYHPNIELFDFNKSTGVLSNLLTIPAMAGYDGLNYPISNLYGLSFSKNSKMLYATQWLSSDSLSKIIQFNVSSNDSIQISNSKFTIFSTSEKNLYSLKLAPDEKIYVAQNPTKHFLGRINFPDSVGLSCGYVDSAISLGSSHSGWGLNNLMEYDEYCTEIPDGISPEISSTIIEVHPNPCSDRLVVTFGNLSTAVYEIRVRSVTGQLFLLPFSRIHSQALVDVHNLPSGVYLLQIVDEHKRINNRKFSVVH
ncbi:MAG: T9SS type A sorting domain-containing protein [Bacteroidetes bacterium]|nr:T9SS type A sorting domain-containing protein [Bacteroidota bacterium]